MTTKRDADVSDDDLPRLELIAEPGRFFVEASHILLVNLIGKKVKYVKPGTRVGCDASVAPHAATASSNSNTTNLQVIEDDNPVPHKRARLCSIAGEQREKIFYYYLNDGVYGSFNCIYFDHAKVEVLPYNERDGARYRSIIFGPTCDSMDKIQTDIELPELEIGEWCFVRNFGAYTTAAASDFNGFTKKKAFYILN
jgi:ornithine decarboxylase